MEHSNKLLTYLKTFILTVLALFYLTPFILVLYNSVKPTKEFLENPIALPKVFNLNNFYEAFDKMNFLSGFMNTLIITSLSVILIVIFSSMTAYGLVRRKTKLSNVLFMMFVAAMIIPFQAIMIPLVKIYGSLGLLNNMFTLIYMYIGFGAPMAIFIFHGFIKTIPLEIEEAAMIDGCSKLRTFYQIVFPLLKPIIMSLVILDVLWIWNDFLLPSLVLIKPAQRTLPLSTFYFFGTYTVNYGLLMAGLLMTILPVLVIYVFLQKYIIEGVMQGSIK